MSVDRDRRDTVDGDYVAQMLAIGFPVDAEIGMERQQHRRDNPVRHPILEPRHRTRSSIHGVAGEADRPASNIRQLVRGEKGREPLPRHRAPRSAQAAYAITLTRDDDADLPGHSVPTGTSHWCVLSLPADHSSFDLSPLEGFAVRRRVMVVR